VRSIYILRVLLDEEYRRHINTQLNKGESLHSLRRFLYCANESLVRKREPEKQLHQALCLTLVTNAVIYWNTLYLDEAVQARRARGDLVRAEDLAHIYPIHYAHINTHGKLHFPVREDSAPRQRKRRPLRDPDAARIPQPIPRRGNRGNTGCERMDPTETCSAAAGLSSLALRSGMFSETWVPIPSRPIAPSHPTLPG
jgi:hypothetical protein